MKITPAKDYKKPLYAVGLAATVMTMAVTGCTAPAEKSKDRSKNNADSFYMQMLGGVAQVGEPEDVVLAGDTQVVETDVYYDGETTISEPENETDVSLAGGAQINE